MIIIIKRVRFRTMSSHSFTISKISLSLHCFIILYNSNLPRIPIFRSCSFAPFLTLILSILLTLIDLRRQNCDFLQCFVLQHHPHPNQCKLLGRQSGTDWLPDIFQPLLSAAWLPAGTSTPQTSSSLAAKRLKSILL